MSPHGDAGLRRGMGGAVKVALIGTAKAGKSTCGNTLLGNDFLPSGTECETVAVVLIQHSVEARHGDGVLYAFDRANTINGEGVVLARGAPAVRAKTSAINRELREQATRAAPGSRLFSMLSGAVDRLKHAARGTPAPAAKPTAPEVYILADGTRLPVQVPQLLLKLPFPASLTGLLPGSPGNLDLFDTPGPNEAAPGARKMVEHNANQILRNADVVLFVIDFTAMGSVQEEEVMK